MNRYRDWLAQAKRDLDKAEIDLQYQYWEWTCFTAQQSAEEAVKALLMHQGIDAWGHAITPLLRRLDKLQVPEDIIHKGQLLDVYYIPTRYPNGLAEGIPADYFNEEKAREGLDASSDILRFCQDHLP
jgi:HEPN domain-containing protein